MSFALSKLLWAVTAPGNLLLLVLLAGVGLLVLGRRGWGALLTGVAATGFAAIAILPVGAWLMWPLEQRFPQPAELPDRVDGIVVLGGAVSPILTADHGQPALNRHAERMTVVPALARRFPEAVIVFTGGSGLLLEQDLKEAPVAEALWAEIGFRPQRLVYESASRNTWENALFSRELVQPPPDSVWLLVTSAAHMPRSVGVFRRAGWNIIPYPVDFQVARRELRRLDLDLADGMQETNAAVRELIGLTAYHLMGRTDVWFPAPRSDGRSDGR